MEILELKARVKELEDMLSCQGETFTTIQEYLRSGKCESKSSMLKRLLETNRKLNSYLKDTSIVLINGQS